VDFATFLGELTGGTKIYNMDAAGWPAHLPKQRQ